MKKFKDLPLDKNLEKYARQNIPNNPDTTSTPEELKKKMLYGSAETFITRLKMKLLYSGIDAVSYTHLRAHETDSYLV